MHELILFKLSHAIAIDNSSDSLHPIQQNTGVKSKDYEITSSLLVKSVLTSDILSSLKQLTIKANGNFFAGIRSQIEMLDSKIIVSEIHPLGIMNVCN